MKIDRINIHSENVRCGPLLFTVVEKIHLLPRWHTRCGLRGDIAIEIRERYY